MISVLLRLVIPLIYCLVMGGGFSYIARKRFSVSLAPAFMLHALFTTVIAIITESVNAGIIAGIAAMIAAVIITVILRRRAGADISYEIRLDEILFFLIIYLLIWALNYDKCFRNPDEFTHWGWFVREIIRTDKLYCASDLPIVHKDYVPAVSVFEAIWCRLSLQYSEPNAYRGIQILAASMMMPMCVLPELSDKTSRAQKYIGLFFRFIIIFTIPMLFEWDFYHTLYQDLLLGVMIAYCMYMILAEAPDYVIPAIALCMLILSKMTAIAFIPMIVIFYGVYAACTSKTSKLRIVLRSLTMTCIPIVFWIVYNSYMRRYLPRIGGQSYDSIAAEDIINVITHNGSITYQADVEQTYLTALRTYGVMDKAPYIALLILLAGVLFIWSFTGKDNKARFAIRLTTLWILLAGIAYGIMMYFLYMTQFSEYEARQLASYSRYMGTYMLAATMIGAAMFLRYTDRDELTPAFSLSAVIALAISMHGLGTLDQILPGFVEIEGIASADRTRFGAEIDYIRNNAEPGASIFVINRGLRGGDTTIFSYYLIPDYDVNTGLLSPGSPAFDGDPHSTSITPSELKQTLSAYDYLLIAYSDVIFEQEYSDIFSTDSSFENGIYRIDCVADDKTIHLIREY